MLVVTKNNFRKFLDNLMDGAFDDMELSQSAWRGATAYHLLHLTYTYMNEGKPHEALITALKLQEFEDIIPPEELYCLLAATSCLDNAFGICSKAFIKLESMEEVRKI